MSVRFCSRCGGELTTTRVEGQSRQYCPDCRVIQYQNPKPCAGVLVVQDDEVLLIKRSVPPNAGTWSLPAGYLEADEPPAHAAVRELAEETGLRTTREQLRLHDTVFVEHPDGQHVLVVIYVTTCASRVTNPVPGSDAAAARFWTLDTLANHPEERLEPGYREAFRAAVADASDS